MQAEAKLNQLLALVDSMSDGPAVDRVRIADSRDGAFYRHDERTRVALKVALITGRPLLLVGPPGCGKSSLAPYVARNLRLELLTYTVTEAAEPSDLLWRVDYLKRLSDAQLSDIKPMDQYVERGVLWRAFQPERKAEDANLLGTLVLLDEIDKADASFSNSLLVAIGSLQFDVPPLRNQTIHAAEDAIVLVMMSSNQERELPPALTRRCVTLSVEFPTAEHLVEITQRYWPMWMREPEFKASVQALAHSLTDGDDASDRRVSTAEFLDLVQVLRKSGISAKDPLWSTVEGLVLLRNEGSY